jgi:SAM-dependent methyltransferase
MINLDLDVNCKPDVLADARFLPFRSSLFEQVILADVMEHLPNEHELTALKEAYRVLMNSGLFILSTPNDYAFYKLLDPARYVMIHRHYSKEKVVQLLEESGFRASDVFAAGGIWSCFANLWYSFVTFPLRKLFGTRLSCFPSLIAHLESEDYGFVRKSGYTIFAKSKKIG